ncbi:GNAT family N-acetyltransferase [bacterium]|jgi:ribosomal protein S18 acetylase RimI-like enzyme|nr:GNAT family N-acetyltransferase [bacterium]MBT5988472.1 GNAT family N-acetyltransferase [bacterium]MBT7088109.1 GNAT family N-acetyltransferase [bacterium]
MLKKIEILEVKNPQEIPYALLLLADPSKEVIDKYLKKCLVFTACSKNKIPCGVVALYPHNKKTIEIKNIAVATDHQNQGISSKLIDFSIQQAKKLGYEYIKIGTGNSSLGQLYLYQKHGFRIKRILTDFFVLNYDEPIIENGLVCKDMLILVRKP